MTCSKNTRPETGRSSTWVRENSACSAPPATATASAPTSCSCAARAPAPSLIDPIALPDLSAARRGDRATPSGCCTPPPRTCPAWPRSACARAGCSTPSSPAGWPASRGSASAALVEQLLGLTPGEGPLGRRLVDPAAARAVAALRRPRRRGARRAARRARRRAGRAGQAGVGRARSSRRWSPRRPPAAPRVDPWRRTSGMHRVRNRRGAGPWSARCGRPATRSPRRRDVAPGRVLPDAAIVAAAEPTRTDERTLLALPGFGGRSVRRLAPTWLAALDRGPALPDDELPPTAVPATARRRRTGGPTATRSRPPGWRRCRAGWSTGSPRQHDLPVENLLTPDRSAGWPGRPPSRPTEDAVAEALRGYGARPWQIGARPPPADSPAARTDARPTASSRRRADRADRRGVTARSWRRPSLPASSTGVTRPSRRVRLTARHAPSRRPPCPVTSATSSSSTASAPRSARPARRACTPRPAPTTWSSSASASCCAATRACRRSGSTRWPSPPPPRSATRA